LSLLSGFPTNILVVVLVCSMLATCPAHLMRLDLITLIISDEEYKLWSSSLRNFFSLLLLPPPQVWIFSSEPCSRNSQYKRLEVFTATKFDKILSGDQPRQFGGEVQLFVDILCLHHHGWRMGDREGPWNIGLLLRIGPADLQRGLYHFLSLCSSFSVRGQVLRPRNKTDKKSLHF
jgi:hypothetical protein